MDKEFNRELVWAEIRNLPKFAVPRETISASVKQALMLDVHDHQGAEHDRDAVSVAGDAPEILATSLAMSNRPTVGKKRRSD